MHINMRNLIFAALPLAVMGATKRTTVGDKFNLYAYGDKFGGFPIIYSNGLAYAGNVSILNSTDAAVVSFVLDDNSHFIASSNTTSSETASWANSTLFVPTASNADRRVGFLPASGIGGNSTAVTTGFSFYGSTAMVIGNNSSISTDFAGLEITHGLWQIFWNDTTGSLTPMTLRSRAPSNGSK